MVRAPKSNAERGTMRSSQPGAPSAYGTCIAGAPGGSGAREGADEAAGFDSLACDQASPGFTRVEGGRLLALLGYAFVVDDATRKGASREALLSDMVTVVLRGIAGADEGAQKRQLRAQAWACQTEILRWAFLAPSSQQVDAMFDRVTELQQELIALSRLPVGDDEVDDGDAKG